MKFRASGAAILLFFLTCAAPVLAVTSTWDGGGTTDNFTDPLNWADDMVPASDLANTDLVFAGTTRTNVVNDSTQWSVHSITLDSAAGSFDFSKHTFVVGSGGITNNALGRTMMFENAVNFSGVASASINAASGGVTFSDFFTMPTDTLLVQAARDVAFQDIDGSSANTIVKTGDGVFSYVPTGPTNFSIQASAGTVGIGDYFRALTPAIQSPSTITISGTATLYLPNNTTFDGATVTLASGTQLSPQFQRTITLQNGATISHAGSIFFSNAPSLIVTGPNSAFNVASFSYSGGTFSVINVLAGGKFSSAGSLAFSSRGTANIDGAGSSLSGSTLRLGPASYTMNFKNGATGTFNGITISPAFSGTISEPHFLNVQSGAKVTNGTSLNVASGQSFAAGTLNVTGTDSVFSNTGAATANVGTTPSGTPIPGAINVSNNGTFNSGTGLTTVNRSGSITVTGATYNSHGDLLLNGGTFTRDATGVLAFDSGRTMTLQAAAQATITGDYTSAANSTITLTGMGSSLSVSNDLGMQRGSTLLLQNAAALTATDLIVGTDGTAASVAITGAGAKASLKTLAIGASNGSNANVTVYSGGALSLAAATFVDATGTLEIKSGGTLTGASDFTGTGTVNIAGSYMPGELVGPNQTPPKSVRFDPTVTLYPTTNIILRIGGTTAGTQHDQLFFNSAAPTQVRWNGTLSVVLMNGFVPQAGQVFHLLAFDPARDAGLFTGFNLPTLDLGLFWRTDRLYVDGTIRVSRAAATFAEWQAAFGAGAFTADDDHDGLSNGIEFLLGTNPKLANPLPLKELPSALGTGGRTAGVQFQIPTDPGAEAHYRIAASSDLLTWTTIASKDDGGPWTGTATVSETEVGDGLSKVTLTETIAADATRRFHRLEAEAP